MIKNLVSVIIPTFGGAKLLSRCVDSVLSQTYKNIEIIVVDDNGLGTPKQKETASVMKKYLSLSNVKYICHEVNRNGSAARNTGVKNSDGEYIALLDDDDMFLPKKIEAQLSALQSCNDDYAICYCSKEIYNEKRKVGERHVTKSGFLLYDVFMHNVIISSTSLLIKRCVWEEFNGFDESFKRHQDWEFTARVTSKYKVIALDEILYRDYVIQRYVPKSAVYVKELIDYYLLKMEPYLDLLTPIQKRIVIKNEKQDIAFHFLREMKIKEMHKELQEGNLGLYSYLIFIKRIFKYFYRRIAGRIE